MGTERQHRDNPVEVSVCDRVEPNRSRPSNSEKPETKPGYAGRRVWEGTQEAGTGPATPKTVVANGKENADMPTRTSRRMTRRAFSLLEILLVVVILGILAAFVVPSLIGTGDQARVDATRAMVGKSGPIATAVSLYHTHIGSYPEELKELTEKPDDEDKAGKWRGPYIEDAGSLKDAWQRDLQYKANDAAEHNEGRYDLWSMGKDGEDGTDDDIGNWEKG